MLGTMRIGVVHTLEYKVTRERTVPFLYPDSPQFQSIPEVFATGYMIGLMEWCCLEALAPFLETGEGSLGTRISVTHLAPTPPGLIVTVTATVSVIQGRSIYWNVSASDGVDIIGEGQIGRTLVRWDRFNDRLVGKAALAGFAGPPP